MLNFCRKHDGAVAVFLTLILIPTFIFSGVIIDGSRILASKNLVSGAGDLAMNAALSNYHEGLNQVYGLLAMADSASEVESIMQECFEMSLNASGVSREDFAKALVYLELTEGGFSASDMVNTEIYQTEVFKQEVLEYMKYRAPVTIVNRAIKSRINVLDTMAEERAAADAELKFEKELGDVQKLFDELNELVDKQNEYVNRIGTQESLTRLLSDTSSNYDKITLLAVAYHRMMNCSDSDSGDMKGLMERMADLACDVSSIDAGTASNLIKMKRIENAMRGQNPTDLLDGLEVDSDEYDEVQRLIDEYENAKSIMEDGIENTEKTLDDLVKKSYTAMHEQWECARDGKENCQDIIEKIAKIRDKLEKCKGKFENWQEAVGNLSNPTTKGAYEESIKEVEGLFGNDGIIGEFEKKINNNKTYFGEVESNLDQVTFTNYRIDYDVSSKAVFMDEADYGPIIESSEVSAAAANFMDRYHTPTVMSLSVQIDKTVDKQDAFVKKLKEEYCNTDSKDEARAKEETKKWKDKLDEKKKALEKLLTSDDIPDQNVRTIAGDALPSVWLGIAEGEGYNQESVKAQGSLEDKESRKEAAESGSDNLNQDNAALTEMSGLSSKIAGLGETVAEPLFLTEYVLDMFSYYTIDHNRDGSANSDPESLSRAKLKDNAIYRAEVEYILWGSSNVRSNVNITKAIIFAANFVFNMSFAFTNSTLGKQARTIAAFFPVGALGKTAIKCALLAIAATIETTDNMIDLMEGKPVPLIKQAGDWGTWLPTNPGGPSSGEDSGFTYEDYLWILVCVNMFIEARQTQLLGRAADCIELNLTEKKTNNANTLKHMYTMVSVDATVSIDTFFLQRLGGADYNVSYDEDAFKVKYHGIQGY